MAEPDRPSQHRALYQWQGRRLVLPHETTIIDSHAHLDDGAFDDDRAAIIARAREASGGAIVNVGFDAARWVGTAAIRSATSSTGPAI